MKPAFSLLLLFCFYLPAFSQITFSDSSASLLADTSLTSGVAMGVTDMNMDGYDDLVRLSNASDLRIEYQNQLGGTFSSYNFGNLGSGTEWSLCVADADSNQINDIFVGGSYNGLKVLTSNGTGSSYSSQTLSTPSIFLQGSNFADIDNDGDVDIFACHDDGISSPYRNNGGAGFTYDLTLINPASTIPSNNSGNYGSTWTDYDNDGDLDMYLSKCRLGVTNPLDGRRVNMMFRNNGNGTFTEVAQSIGLRPLAQSWASDFADIDNDGDLDCFIINHDSLSQFFRNNGNGTFTDITATTGTATDLAAIGLAIQCIFEDFDNDTYVDLLVTGRSGEHRLFKNNGNLTFTAVTNPFPTALGIQSAAVGDLNSDGYPDVYAGFATGFNTPSSNSDKVFINNGGNQGFIRIWLEGVTSNYNGIGARLELYGPWGVQLREVRSGESYGIMNSLIQHFGTGTAFTIDSLVVRWPSGTVDKVCNPPVAGSILVKEGAFPNTNLSAGFTWTNLDTLVNFTDSTVGQPFNWFWTFGDGSSSSNPGPTHTYSSYGTYQVCLTVNNSCFFDTACQTINVTCNAPVSGFSWTSVDTNVTFTNTSTGGSPQTWAWDFGDGNTSSLKNPQHTYSTAGTYTVCLITTNSCDADTLCQSVTVSCQGGPVFAGFQAFISDTTVVFLDTSTGLIVNHFWDFGDGNTSTDVNPRHTYSAPGTYVVCLTVVSSCESDTICDTIQVSCPTPSASFSFLANDTVVTFSDQSGVTVNSWRWDFGDGNISTQQNPIHSYAAPGDYLVCFRINTACGLDSICDTVSVTCPPPSASFLFTSNDTVVTFTDNSGLPATGWFWDFGDGNTSTLQNPVHTYSGPGNYLVCFRLETECGNDTVCDSVTTGCPAPVADFSSSINGLMVDFMDQSSAGTANWSWDFGDGNASTSPSPSHTYADTGTYVVCLTVSNNCGFTTACDTLFLSPSAIGSIYADFVIGRPFPNPSSGVYFVDLTASHPLQVRMLVSDLLGRKMGEWTEHLSTGERRIRLDLSGFQQGLYLLKLETESHSKSFFLMKQ